MSKSCNICKMHEPCLPRSLLHTSRSKTKPPNHMNQISRCSLISDLAWRSVNGLVYLLHAYDPAIRLWRCAYWSESSVDVWFCRLRFASAHMPLNKTRVHNTGMYVFKFSNLVRVYLRTVLSFFWLLSYAIVCVKWHLKAEGVSR